MKHHAKPNSQSKKSPIILLGVCAAIAISIGSFFGGMQFQKSRTKPLATFGNQQFAGGEQFSFGQGDMNGGPRMGGPRGFNGTIGTVTEISASSITVQNERSNTTKTYAITTDTQITNDGTAATSSDITKGDTVLVTTDSTDTSTATKITLNPTMGTPPQ